MSRNETIKTERRRRNSAALGGARQRLYVNEEALDREKYAYRWANDTDNRIHQLTVQDDYEVVPDRDGVVNPDGIGNGAEVAVPAGMTKDDRPMRAILLRKPKEFYLDDQREKHRAIDAQEAGIKTAGSAPGAGSSATYVKDGTSIRRG